MHEIITLQLGQQANYLGTHFWNTQESYFTYDETLPVEHDRSFRQGVGVDGADTYTPRVLVYDLKNAFGTLERDNALYEAQTQETLQQQNAWGHASTIQLPAIPESEYQQALNAGTTLPPLQASTVRYWSDYNHIFYHPRSMIQLSEYEVNSSLMPFERYSTGEDLFASLDKEHDLLDRDLRPFLEECDQLQAINVIASTTDAWGGFAGKYVESISDDLGKGSRWLFGLQGHSGTRHGQASHLANTVQCLDAVAQHVSLHFPMRSRPGHLWQVTALQAVAVETLTLPTRLREMISALQLEEVLNLDGHRGIATSGLIEREEKPEADARMTNGLSHDEVEETEPLVTIDFFPGKKSGRNRVYSSLEVARGDGDESDRGDRTMTIKTSLAFPVLPSFPPDATASDRLQAVSCSSQRVATYLRESARGAHAFLPMENREALYDSLINLAEEYEESMSFSDSDDMDDD